MIPTVALLVVVVSAGPFPPAINGTDKGLYNESFLEGDITPLTTTKTAVADRDQLWPAGAVVFRIEDSIGCPKSPQCEILMRAMDHYHLETCVRFKEWTGEDDYVSIFFNPESGACWSTVGHSGDGVQYLSLGERCWYFGIVLHELGHAVGFWHEMNRPDRDDWIYIHWDNIVPNFYEAFLKQEPESVNTLGEKFDYRSIMMYDEYAFSKDYVSPTLQAKQDGVVIGPIWKKNGLSAGDIRRVYKLYGCENNRPLPDFPYDVHCNFNQHTCGFKNEGSKTVWKWRGQNSSEGYMQSSSRVMGSAPGYFISVNMHNVTEDDREGCLRFRYVMHGNGSYFRVSQIYLDNVTQLSYSTEDVYDLWEMSEPNDKWNLVEVPLEIADPFKLIFISSFNDSNKLGTIALDDVLISYKPCKMNTTQRPSTTTIKPVTTTMSEPQNMTMTTSCLPFSSVVTPTKAVPLPGVTQPTMNTTSAETTMKTTSAQTTMKTTSTETTMKTTSTETTMKTTSAQTTMKSTPAQPTMKTTSAQPVTIFPTDFLSSGHKDPHNNTHS
ncbi:meprin A subunit beta-like [Anabrus simplex]|uniref:meprin A subunit beta-like n=1 Tax=Anabrus simplex TaxID=316456 RepID=UPI0035A342D7